MRQIIFANWEINGFHVNTPFLYPLNIKSDRNIFPTNCRSFVPANIQLGTLSNVYISLVSLNQGLDVVWRSSPHPPKKYLFLSNLLFLVVFLKKYFHIQMPFEKLEPVLNF